MDRRGFLKTILAAGVAPVFIKSDSLMKLIAPSQAIISQKQEIIIPEFTMYSGNPIVDSNFAKLLWPGVKEYWARVYDERSYEEYNLWRKN
jgi:hypothetical protein